MSLYADKFFNDILHMIKNGQEFTIKYYWNL